jgi:[NiFe] hydrogenase diaphorase moiety small subunit
MSDTFEFTIDGQDVTAKRGQTIMQAADEAGIYIPRLCAQKELTIHGSCRVCTVRVNGRPQAACTQPAAPGMVVEAETDEMKNTRKAIVEMLFVEGNHICPFCEKSGNCELQALSYRLGIAAPRFPFLFPEREVDATHPDILVDHNRCVLCGRCVRASKDLDGKHVFEFVGRSIDKRVAVNAEARLGGTNIDISDKAVELCPVGAILKKRVGYSVPVGKRTYDKTPIGSEIEQPQASE